MTNLINEFLSQPLWLTIPLCIIYVASLTYFLYILWHYRRNSFAVVLTIVTLAMSQTAMAENGWNIQASTSDNVTTFTITRTNTAVAETVRYRLVNMSAFAGQHFNVTQVNGQSSNALSGELTFTAGDTDSRTIQVTESAGSGAYSYYKDAQRSYKLEITDIGGFYLTSNTRSFTKGTQFSTDKVSQSITNLVYFSGSNYASGVNSSKYVDVSYTPPSGQVETSGTLQGYVLIDDSYDYAQKPATVSTSDLINTTGANATYLNNVGYKIYATVCFTEKEKDDGYQYIQIIAGNGSASYDGADPEGSVNNPVNSVYKTCFELSNNSNAEGKQYFPHRYNYANKSAETSASIGITEFSQTNGKLWQQAFQSGYQATNSGSLIFDANTSYITTRFDAGGNNDDTWGYKDFFVRMALVDASSPSKLAVSVAPGRHSKGNTVYVTVAFNEIVKVTGTPKLTTENNWGDLSYVAGDGTNVLTFSRTIPANASGNLNITGLSGTVKDLAGNDLVGSGVTASNLCSLDASYAYPITYNLDEGVLPDGYPATYTYDAAVTLTNPTKTGYWFNGWTGSNGDTPQTTVTIANHSHGNKSYTANWTPVWTGSGTQGDPYTITTPLGLDLLAQYVNSGNNCSGLYFQLGGPVDYTHTNDWYVASEENNYTAIGTYDNPFQGTFDGNSNTVSGIRIYKGGSSSSDKYQGLFGAVKNGGTVKRVTLSDARITGYDHTGGIAGESFNAIIEDCTVAADVCIHTVLNSAYYHGGIVGYNQEIVRRCISRATLSVADGLTGCMDYGGIVGKNNGVNGGTITDCIADGVVIPDVNGRGAILGVDNKGVLTRNYYRNCTVAGTENATGIGKGSSESNKETSDVPGARSIHTLSLPEHVTVSGGETVTYNAVTYYAAGVDFTLSPGAGFALANVQVNGNDATDNGDGTWSFTMPAEDATVTATVSVPYIDADGTTQYCTSYTLIESSTKTYGSISNDEAWYAVSGEVTISGPLYIRDKAVHLILCDGATLSVTKNNDDVLLCPNGSLTIYGQSAQSGTLTASTTGNYCAIRTNNGDITINGGIISATSSYHSGIYAYGSGSVTINRGSVTATGSGYYGIFANNNVTINGGTVSATGGIYGINAGDGTITLGCATAADRIYASSYSENPVVKSGQILTDDTNTYSGSVNLYSIAGTTLRPYGVTVAMNSLGVMTYASPFALDLSNVDAYVISDYNNGNSTLTLTKVDEAPANTGLLLKAQNDEQKNTTIALPLKENAAAVGTNLLVGVLSSETVVPQTDGPNTNFILANGKYGIDWYTLSADGAIGANKAYLQLPTAQISGAREFTWVYDSGEATSVHSSQFIVHSEADAWYDLNGRKLSGKPTQKGIYINNGKKVVVK